MEHVKTIQAKNQKQLACKGGCGECQTSCQSACKTSCTVANQKCENLENK
ncbi:six-cysteine ranthipeptide SCIFF [Ruminococcaceae bacterium OttesenSCG-928-O06]|nr:six-cysteine ranthipeptide SCIFF [Ruminococcaceae bacterium OttesenSCG-928-O06]